MHGYKWPINCTRTRTNGTADPVPSSREMVAGANSTQQQQAGSRAEPTVAVDYNPSWTEELKLKEHIWHCIRPPPPNFLQQCYTAESTQRLLALVGSVEPELVERALQELVGRKETQEYQALLQYHEKRLQSEWRHAQAQPQARVAE